VVEGYPEGKNLQKGQHERQHQDDTSHRRRTYGAYGHDGERLQREGYQVISATSAAQAIETATSLAGRIALVIVNHSISTTSGQDLVEAI
jgi:DNA-binding NtrC family response regulator